MVQLLHLKLKVFLTKQMSKQLFRGARETFGSSFLDIPHGSDRLTIGNVYRERQSLLRNNLLEENCHSVRCRKTDLVKHGLGLLLEAGFDTGINVATLRRPLRGGQLGGRPDREFGSGLGFCSHIFV